LQRGKMRVRHDYEITSETIGESMEEPKTDKGQGRRGRRIKLLQ